MPESIVNITPGTGQKLHSFQRVVGANTVEDEIVLIGEPHLATYAVSTAAVTTVTATSHLLQIMAGSAKPVLILRIWAEVASGAGLENWELRRLTTAGTGGTQYIPEKMDPADAASGFTAMSRPTTKGTEGNAILRGQLDASTPLSLDINFQQALGKPLVIAAGPANGIALKCTTGDVDLSFWINALVAERTV